MVKARMGARLAAGCLLLWGGKTMAAPPSSADMLRFRPKQEGVVYTTPAEPEQVTCKVEPIVRQNKTIGWVLTNAKGQVLRRFFDTTGSGKTDAWCYYHNGTEVYREVYSPQGDQYRWLNGGGMKWGLDLNRDGKIDSWRMISAEEVSQEILIAVVKKDFARLQALMITEAELKALELPADMANRIRETQKGAPAKFQQTLNKLGNLGDKIRWVHLETPPPQCLPADGNLKQDLLRYHQGSVTYINEGATNQQPAELLTGEMILVGQAWRLIDAPVPSEGVSGVGPKEDLPNPELRVLLEELKKLDDKGPDPSKATPAEVAQYNLKRAELLEKIAAKAPAEETEQWLRQVADCLGASVQNSPASDKIAFQRLTALRERVAKDHAGSNLLAHVIFCEMSADYSMRLNTEKDIAKLQQEWVDKLTKFVQDFPRSEDTPDALMQLGMVNELLGKEDVAKKWYELLAKDFASHPHASKARGSVNRLSLDGKELALAGRVLGTGGPFDIKSLKGKVVVVYYWASWNQQSAADFGKLKTLHGTYASKGFEVVCVNLDEAADLATGFLQKNPAPGIQLREDGGLSSPLAEPYGIQVLPTLFLVGKEGKVVSRTVQMNNLEDEVQKALK